MGEKPGEEFMVVEPIPLFKVYSDPSAPAALQTVLDSGYLGQGPRVDELERELSLFWNLGGEGVVALNSGTSALDLAYHLALDTLADFPRVLMPPLTCAATATPLLHRIQEFRGGVLEWYDCDPLTGCPNLQDLLTRCNRSEKPPNMVVLVSFAGRDLTPLVEDLRNALHHTTSIIVDYAHCAPLPPPLLADYTCYSFQAIKHLTTGDGGALVCASPADTSRARLLRWYGLSRGSGGAAFRCEQDLIDPGFKYHMNDLAAALGLANLGPGGDGLRDRLFQHQSNALHLSQVIRDCPRLTAAPYDPSGAYWLYPVLCESRGAGASLIAHLASLGITAGRPHRRLDTHPCFSPFKRDLLPGVEEFSSRHVCLPCGWWLDEAALDRLTAALLSWKGA